MTQTSPDGHTDSLSAHSGCTYKVFWTWGVNVITCGFMGGPVSDTSASYFKQISDQCSYFWTTWHQGESSRLLLATSLIIFFHFIFLTHGMTPVMREVLINQHSLSSRCQPMRRPSMDFCMRERKIF